MSLERRKSLSLPIAILVALNVAITAFLWHSKFAGVAPPKSYSYRGSDYPETFPIKNVGQAAMTVEESVHFPIAGSESFDDWDSQLGVTGHFRLGPESRLFTFSMSHEMHCLQRLRDAMAAPPAMRPHHLGHVQHCLNYIRQMILCEPDLTLEPYDPLARDFSVERTGATHTCRDWGAIYAALDDNYSQFLNDRHLVKGSSSAPNRNPLFAPVHPT